MRSLLKNAKLGLVALGVLILILIFIIIAFVGIYKGLANAFNV